MRISPPLKITHVVFSFNYGGLERRILRLIDGLTPLGAEFRIVSLRPSEGAFLAGHPDVEHIVLQARPGIDWLAIRRLTTILRESGTHIVHSHNWVSMLEGIVAGRLARVPVVLHGEHGVSRFEVARLQWKRTLIQRILCRAADSIVPVNDAIRDRITDVWRLPPSRCTVIRNGVDTDKFIGSVRTEQDVITVGSISRLEAIKNFPCLIRAVHHINESSHEKKFRLIIVGDGSERQPLEQIVSELGAQTYVSLPGPTDAPENWYPQFDLYVNCSFSEGMSNTVLEAMSCSLPIIATDVAGHRDWLTEDANTLFFASDNHIDLAAKIYELGSNRILSTEMGLRNREVVLRSFSQTRFINDYTTHYRNLLLRKGIELENGKS